MANSRFLPICLLAASSACSPDAAPYRNPIDRFFVDYGRIAGFHYWPCAVDRGPDVIASLPSEQCYRFDPPRRMRGVWMPGLEASEFLLDATSAPASWTVTGDDSIWLETDWTAIDSQLPPPLKVDGKVQKTAYRIEFIGRRATYPGIYGGGGFFGRHLILLDTLISAHAIPGTPSPDPETVRRMLLRWAEEKERCRAEEAAARSPFTRTVFASLLRSLRPGRIDRSHLPLSDCPALAHATPAGPWWSRLFS